MGKAFNCQGKVAGCLGMWLLSIMGYMIYLNGNDEILFFKIGPNKNVKFIGIVIDTWEKWNLLIIFTAVTQSLKMFADEIISPWIINTIMDEKTIIDNRNIDYYRTQTICQTYYLFSAIVKIFQVSISITQIDFVMVYIFTDIAISIYTTDMYLKSKTSEYSSLILK